MKDKQWMRSKYEEIRKRNSEQYIFVNMKIKRLRIINFLNSRDYGDEVIKVVYDVVSNFLNEDEYIAKTGSSSFDILMRFPKGVSDHDLLRRFNALDERLDNANDGLYKGVIFCGFGLFFMSEYDVDYTTAQYYAEVSRSQSPENGHLISHLNIYGHDFIDPNLRFATLRKDFNTAMQNHDFQIFLQPKVDLKSGEVVSAEALIRWIDPEKGMIPISDYLPILDENGLTNMIDKFVFEQACIYTKKWLEEANKKIQISVNVSKTTFDYWLFFEEYKEIYEQYQSPKDCLQVELLESIVLNQVDRVVEIVEQIQDYGISCSLDDFGSGYSSFSVLTSSAIDEVKIDRSLFMNYGNKKERDVVKHIVLLAKQLGMEIVAEGVEDIDYVRYLQELGCDSIQGFVFYKPMSVSDFEQRFIRNDEKVMLP